MHIYNIYTECSLLSLNCVYKNPALENSYAKILRNCSLDQSITQVTN